MKDHIQTIIVGIIISAFTAAITFFVTQSKQPNLQLLIDKPIDLATERITVFRLRNYGGGVATGAEVRFSGDVALSNISAIAKSPAMAIAGQPAVVSAERLKPNDGIEFFIREPKGSNLRSRELVESAVYNEGGVTVSTLDERLESYVRNKQISAFSFGIVAEGLFIALLFIGARWSERRTVKPAGQ